MTTATTSPSLVPPAATGRKALSVLIVSTFAFTSPMTSTAKWAAFSRQCRAIKRAN